MTSLEFQTHFSSGQPSWLEDPMFSILEWQEAVIDDHTLLSYWDWVLEQHGLLEVTCNAK